MTPYQFLITGKVMPAVRMTHRGKFASARAQAYLASQETIRLQIANQMRQHNWPMLPDKTPLNFEASITMAGNLYRADIDNLLKALIDSAQGIVFRNDLWIVESRASKCLGLEHSAYITVWITQ